MIFYSLCLLASIQFYYYEQFFSSLMVDLHLGLIFFISRSLEILFPFFGQLRMIKIVHDGNNVFNKNIVSFLFLIVIEVLLVNQIKIRLNIQFFMVFATEEVAVFFSMTKYVSSLSITGILNFTSFGIIFYCLESFSIINHTFLNGYSSDEIGNLILQLNLVS